MGSRAMVMESYLRVPSSLPAAVHQELWGTVAYQAFGSTRELKASASDSPFPKGCIQRYRYSIYDGLAGLP